MKTHKFIILLVFTLTFLFAGCSKSEDEETTIYRKEISLSTSGVGVDEITTIAQIHISSGNGGYKIVYPKEIWMEGQDIPYSDTILAVHIDSTDHIIIERKLLDSSMVEGIFMVTDNKGAQSAFQVRTLHTTGGLDSKEHINAALNNPDYWQN